MRWTYAVLLAALVHVLLVTASRFPTVQRRLSIDRPDVTVSIREERPLEWRDLPREDLDLFPHLNESDVERRCALPELTWLGSATYDGSAGGG